MLIRFKENLKARGFSGRSIPDYLYNVGRFLDYLTEIGVREMNEVDYQTLADYQVRLLDETYRGKPIGTTSKLRRLSTVRCFFQFLLKSGAVASDPTVDLDLPKRPKSLPKNILTRREMGKLLGVPNLDNPLGLRDRTILEVFYSTGIRVSELCNLTIHDVDTNRGELRVNHGKRGKDRIVPLGEVACDYLNLYLRNSRRRLADPFQTALFVTKNGKPFERTTMSHLMIRYGEKARLKKRIGCHSLRHTCASHLLQGKANIRHIQEILGHASLATTQVYTKVEIADLKRVHHRCHPREQRGIPVNDGWN